MEEMSTNLGNSSTACPMLVAISPLESQPCFVSLLTRYFSTYLPYMSRS